MTREQKLALIVGFSLVLLVGVLISDHLSRARQAKIASITPAENTPPAAVTPPMSDPLKPLEIALGGPSSAVPAGPSLPPSAPASPQAQPETQTPVTIVQNQHAPAGDQESALAEAIRKQGGMMMQGANGITDIILPGGPAAAATSTTTTAPITSPEPRTSPLPKNLATNEQIKYHAVQKGETLFAIAARYYGTGHVWRQLAKFNGLTDREGGVRLGSRLKIPSKDVLLGKTGPVETAGTTPQTSPLSKPEPSRKREMPVAKPEIRLATYTVKRGETLGEISKKVLGTSKRWHELVELNKLDDEDAISAGTVLKLPPMRG